MHGSKIQAITERVENIVGSGKGGSVLVHVWTNNVEREGTTAIVRKYRNLVRTLKQTRVEQVILSGILPVIGRRGHIYRNCRGMAINMLVFADGLTAAVDSGIGSITNSFGSQHYLN